MAMEEVLDKYNRKRILGNPAKAVAKREFNCWTLPDDAQVDTANGIKTVPGGSILVETEKDIVEPMSMLEFTQLYLMTEETDTTNTDVIADEVALQEISEPSEPDPDDLSITN